MNVQTDNKCLLVRLNLLLRYSHENIGRTKISKEKKGKAE